MKLKDKSAIVTGGANGIGQAIAFKLAHEGANVVVADIDSKNAEKVVDEIKTLGREAIAVNVDVTKMNEVKLMVQNDFERVRENRYID